MNIVQRGFLIVLAYLSLTLTGHNANALSLSNGDFEDGTLSGWTVFTTPNGTVGGGAFPEITPFQTTAGGAATQSARFRVGQLVFDTNPAGGGIAQTTMLNGDGIHISADIAASYASATHRRNLDAGSFELLFDGRVVDRHAFGPIPAGSTLHSQLAAELSITPGLHEIGIRMTRPFVSASGVPAPFQYIDNVALTVTSTPEPAPMILLATGLAGLIARQWHAARRQRTRRHAHP